VQTTHWPVEVLQTGVVPEHWAFEVHPLGTHWPEGVAVLQV
jgi:hypothetical protein